MEDGIKKIDLLGRMDIDGTQDIAMKLTAEAAVERTFVILDLSGLDFMASIGIGTLMSVAKSLKLRRGKMVLLNPKPVVALVLERTHIQTAIPICRSFEEARKMLFDPTP
jgi:anti-sigma B factor antagonist